MVMEFTIPGDRVTFEGSLLVSVRKIPFGPAGNANVIGNGTQRPSDTDLSVTLTTASKVVAAMVFRFESSKMTLDMLIGVEPEARALS